MIKFISKYQNQNTGTISSFKNNLHAIASEKIANQLNGKEIKIHCDVHTNVDSVVSVDMKDEISYEIESVCCDDFKIKLSKFLQLS